MNAITLARRLFTGAISYTGPNVLEYVSDVILLMTQAEMHAPTHEQQFIHDIYSELDRLLKRAIDEGIEQVKYELNV